MLYHCPFLLITTFILNIALSDSEHFIKSWVKRPDTFPEYIAARDSCDWQPAGADRLFTCEGDVLTCRVNVSLPEGEGYVDISRFGPFTTTGGFQQVYCYSNLPPIPQGGWVVRGVMGPVDPYTGDFFEFPPIHVHHFAQAAQDIRRIPRRFADHMPWLSYLQRPVIFTAFPSGGADYQCMPEMGNMACLSRVIPFGYAKRGYNPNGRPLIVMHTQDVRLRDSPPLSHYIEYAETIGTKPRADMAALKPVIDFCIEDGGAVNPFSYTLKYNTAMFNFVTYYFPMRAQLVANRAHIHAQNGDEMWIVRGRQRDLGFSKEIQRPVVHKKGFNSLYGAIPLPGGRDLKEFMTEIEKALYQSAAEYSSNNITEPKERSKDIFLPFRTEYEDVKQPLHKPQILCKYYGQTLHVTPEDIQNKAASFKDRFPKDNGRSGIKNIENIMNLVGAGGGASSLENMPVPENHYQAEDDKSTPVHKLVSANEQMNNAYVGVLPGNYYRAPSSSQERRETAYPPNCNSLEVFPGDFITMIHFLQPRLFEGDPTKEFNDTMLTIDQHSRLYAEVHTPDFDIM